MPKTAAQIFEEAVSAWRDGIDSQNDEPWRDRYKHIPFVELMRQTFVLELLNRAADEEAPSDMVEAMAKIAEAIYRSA